MSISTNNERNHFGSNPSNSTIFVTATMNHTFINDNLKMAPSYSPPQEMYNTLKIYPGTKMKDFINDQKLQNKENIEYRSLGGNIRETENKSYRSIIGKCPSIDVNEQFVSNNDETLGKLTDNLKTDGDILSTLTDSVDTINVVGMDLMDVNYRRLSIFDALRDTSLPSPLVLSNIYNAPSSAVDPFMACNENTKRDTLWSTNIFPRNGKLNFISSKLNKSLETLDCPSVDENVVERRYNSRSLPRSVSDRINTAVTTNINLRQKNENVKKISNTKRERSVSMFRKSACTSSKETDKNKSPNERKSRFSHFYNLFPSSSEHKRPQPKITVENSVEHKFSNKLPWNNISTSSRNKHSIYTKSRKLMNENFASTDEVFSHQQIVDNQHNFAKNELTNLNVKQRTMSVDSRIDPLRMYSAKSACNIHGAINRVSKNRHKSLDLSNVKKSLIPEEIIHETNIYKDVIRNRLHSQTNIFNCNILDALPEESFSLPTSPIHKCPPIPSQRYSSLSQFEFPTKQQEELPNLYLNNTGPQMLLTKPPVRQRSPFVHSKHSSRLNKSHSSSSGIGFRFNQERNVPNYQEYSSGDLPPTLEGDLCQRITFPFLNNHNIMMKREVTESRCDDKLMKNMPLRKESLKFPEINATMKKQYFINEIKENKCNKICSESYCSNNDLIHVGSRKSNTSGQYCPSCSHRLTVSERFHTLTDFSSRFSERKMIYEEEKNKKSAHNKACLTDDLRIAPQEAKLNLSEDLDVSGRTSSSERNNSSTISLEITAPGLTTYPQGYRRETVSKSSGAVNCCPSGGGLEEGRFGLKDRGHEVLGATNVKCWSEENIASRCCSSENRIRRTTSHFNIRKNILSELPPIAKKLDTSLRSVKQKVIHNIEFGYCS